MVKKIIQEVLKALSILHENNIIHTDLKPENILLVNNINNIEDFDDFHIKLIDMGSSMLENEIDTHSIGTDPYLAPEVVLRGDYDKSVDIWALGNVIFELTTGNLLIDPEDYYQHSETSSYSSYNSDDIEKKKYYNNITIIFKTNSDNYTDNNSNGFKFTNITKEMCDSGVTITEALKHFYNAYNSASYIVAHNIDFDKKMIQLESLRHSEKYEFLYLFNDVYNIVNKKIYCTMQLGKDITNIKIKGKFGEFKELQNCRNYTINYLEKYQLDYMIL